MQTKSLFLGGYAAAALGIGIVAVQSVFSLGFLEAWGIGVMLAFSMVASRNWLTRARAGDVHPRVKGQALAAIGVAVVSLIAAGVIRFALGFMFMDETFHEGLELSGSAKAIESEFQRHFYGRESYPRYTLADLETAGILSKSCCEYLRNYHARYKPFGPDTPGDVVVLRLQGGFLNLDTIEMTKRELTKKPEVMVVQ
jgi:hypothetical protein